MQGFTGKIKALVTVYNYVNCGCSLPAYTVTSSLFEEVVIVFNLYMNGQFAGFFYTVA